MNEVRQILKAIEQYAKAYNQLEDMQKKMRSWLPIGDQKTGVIGEFYTKIYLESIYPDAEIVYGNPSQRGWDLEIKAGPKCIRRVQVKTVSEYSNARRISPIHSGWDRLFLVYLDKKFLPVALWEIDTNIVPEHRVLKNRTMPKPGDPKSGSVAFANRKDRLAELLQAIQRIKDEL